MSDFIPVNEPLLNGNEKKYLLECIDTGWISSEGPFISKFENSFAARVGRKFAVAVSNGTAAIDVALEALNITKGDEIILPSFTIISCISHIIRIGAIPVLVDSLPDTWNMDVSQIEQRITSKTKAILVVHIYGLPVDIQPVLNIASRYGLRVIEDAAEMHGQTYDGRPCGSFGDISTFSFYANKHVTTGEGGMVVTDDQEIAESIRSLRNLCMKPSRRFVHDRLGWNLRMTNLQAALGLAQLEQLDEFVRRKRAMGDYYQKELSDLSALQLPLAQDEHAENIYWVFGLVLRDESHIDAQEAIKRLGDLGIGTRPFFWGMHEQPVLNRLGFFKNDRFPVSERLSRQGFYIPSGLAITEIQMQKVCLAIHSIFD